MQMRTAARRTAMVMAGAGVVQALAALPAQAALIPYPSEPLATPLARAMARDQGLVRKAVFTTLPPSVQPAAVSTTPLAGFPTLGKTFAVLTTGKAVRAAFPNTAGNSGSQSTGTPVKGARDVTTMRVDLRVPKGDNCLSFNFRFLSEEYPEFVGSEYNDAFIAEVGRTTWRASGLQNPKVTSPDNFATDAQGAPIRINKVGMTTMSAANAKGTTYDGATRILRASTKVQPGNRRLYLSIFDQGDRSYDSAVFLDDLRTSRATSCPTGVRVAG